ncbi:MAG TPA: co-chaperone GroES [Actinocrinis sp.]|nr:co-chaperone GroES [Actinocrinis sp.]
MSPRSKSDDENPVVPAEAAASLKSTAPSNRTAPSNSAASLDKLPIKMLHDRVLVRSDGAEGERRSSGGILIPATAQMSHRLAWAQVVAIGQNVRTVEIGDRVLYDPDERAEVEVRGVEYVLLRERDIHAVAAERLGDSSGATGLYL